MVGSGTRTEQQRRDCVCSERVGPIHSILTANRYKKAYDSMKACPLKFDHPNEAQQLQGLGPKLCDRLADKLKAHCTEKGLPMPQLIQKGQKRQSDDDDNGGTQRVKKARKVKAYVPALRS